MKKFATTFSGALFVISVTFGQVWVQTGSIPEGAGVNQMIYQPSTGYIYITTHSFGWPGGQDGGIRRSADDEDSWENLVDCYSARVIASFDDTSIYAS